MKKDNDKILNGYMTNNMEDVIFLGKQMENMRDGKHLDEDERSPDPKQFDEDDYTNNQKLALLENVLLLLMSSLINELFHYFVKKMVQIMESENII